MPLAAPIGSGLGIQNKTNIRIIRSQTKLPLIIDAGLGQAADATIAMELGCDAVLVNTAIAKAKNPFQMAIAMKNAVLAGRDSYLSGRISKSDFAIPSSPTTPPSTSSTQRKHQRTGNPRASLTDGYCPS